MILSAVSATSAIFPPMDSVIRIVNAHQNNLKGISVDLPHRELIVVTGPSGSGKSTLAFDTLYAEGQRRYIESLSTYAKQFLDRMPKPQVDRLEGLVPRPLRGVGTGRRDMEHRRHACQPSARSGVRTT